MKTPGSRELKAERRVLAAILVQLDRTRKNYADNPILLRVIADRMQAVKDRLVDLRPRKRRRR